MKAVILAAGRGSRLGNLTDARPKGMVEVEGLPLLEWQRRTLIAAGAESVTVITGYCAGLIDEYGFDTIHNADWVSGNMMTSLDLALARIPGPLIVSYADILYEASAVAALRMSDGPLAVTFDRNWLDLWQKRFEDPLSDAETFRIDSDGNLAEIGGKTDIVEDIEGQFMGLFKLQDEGRAWIEQLLKAEPEARQKLDTTAMLSRLIADGKSVHTVPVSGGWCEVDDQHDLAVAKSLIADGSIELTGRLQRSSHE